MFENEMTPANRAPRPDAGFNDASRIAQEILDTVTGHNVERVMIALGYVSGMVVAMQSQRIKQGLAHTMVKAYEQGLKS